MPRRSRRQTLVRLRLSVRGLRRVLRPYRLLIAGGAGAIGAVLGAVYNDINANLRIAAIVAIGVLTAIAVLLTEQAPPAVPPPPPQFRQRSRAAPRKGTPLTATGATKGGAKGGATEAKPQRSRAPRASSPPVAPRMPLSQQIPVSQQHGLFRRVPVHRIRLWPVIPLWRRVPVWRLQRTRVAPAAPPGDTLFRGRERELAELAARHESERTARSLVGRRPAGMVAGSDASRTTTGPIMLLIHGKPGVGKSALALELAHRLVGDYPHGQVYANLGTLGEARSPAEIFKEFLDVLGWPAHEIPASMVERAKIFRSLTTNRRMLFILDAARNPSQVLHLLPTEARCAVIVTSRRDLGPELNTTSYPLDVPDTDEAITILRAASGTDDGSRPECAVDIVESCGALPLALRAAAERASLSGTELCHLASLLRPPVSRLSWLERPGTSVAGRVASQYDRLLDQEQRALRLLTLVDSATFVPWVLTPLLNVPPAEAENLVIRLNAAQMLDNAGRDEPTGLARYRFHPLVRLYVQAKLRAGEERREIDAARKRLEAAYREVIVAVLTTLDQTFLIPRTRRYLPRRTDFVQLVARYPEAWVRAEYPNLLRRINLSQHDEPGLCWRIAAQLDGCVPQGLSSHLSLVAYVQAASAAEQEGDQIGLIEVLLAKGSFLVALERYRDAQRTLRDAAELAFKLRRSAHPEAETAARKEVVALRKLGEGYLQMASHRDADRVLRQALNAATACGDDSQREFIRMLLAETHQIDGAEASLVDAPDGRINDARRFRAFLALAESDRRRAAWDSARAHLAKALTLNSGDARRVATVQYRMARLYLNEHLAMYDWPDFTDGQVDDDPEVLSPAEQAVRRAATAAVMFRRMGNDVGVVRSHCLLARALLASGYLVEAERVAHTAVQELSVLDGLVGDAIRPLSARVRRTMGDLMLCRGDLIGGRRLLLQAATIFSELDDWAAESEALHRLRFAPWTTDGRASLPALDDIAAWDLPRRDLGGEPGRDHHHDHLDHPADEHHDHDHSDHHDHRYDGDFGNHFGRLDTEGG